MKTKICKQCKKEFSKKKTSCSKSWAKSMFCSRACTLLFNRNKQRNSVEKKCVVCGKIFSVQKYRDDTAKCCSSKCYHIHRDNGKSTESHKIRTSKEFKLWRELVYERDDWTCQKCLVRGQELNPHHIENFSTNEEKRFDIDNGITLCRKCHYDFHSEYGFNDNNRSQIDEFLAVGVQS